jgi:two-component system sensor histidine kinase MtrB
MMELRKVVRVLAVTIALGTVASSASLILITSYLHRLASQIDSNLQSVRAAEEIQLNLLWHARNANQATLLANPELAAAAVESQSAVYQWYTESRRYVGSLREKELVDRLEQEIDSYFEEHAALAAAGIPPLDRYIGAVAPFKTAYDVAEELLGVNLEQAAAANEQGRRWDELATVIGFSVATILLVLMTIVIVGARATLYRPLIALRDGLQRYAAREYSTRVSEKGANEIREIARSFNEMAGALQRQREAQLAFIAAVAHDLRNPLAAMKAGVDVLSSDRSSRGQQHDQMTAMISRQIELLIRMISDLLDAARVEAGHFSVVPTACDARDLVTQAVELFRGTSASHEINVHVPQTPLPLCCDPLRMSQVLNNLVNNAIKYSPQGGQVNVTARRIDDRIAIDIADQGAGIPPEDQQLIFEPFRRGPGTEAAIPGVGIGLSVARRIVEAHGGSIELKSSVGRGSIFSVSLPTGAVGTGQQEHAA